MRRVSSAAGNKLVSLVDQKIFRFIELIGREAGQAVDIEEAFEVAGQAAGGAFRISGERQRPRHQQRCGEFQQPQFFRLSQLRLRMQRLGCGFSEVGHAERNRPPTESFLAHPESVENSAT